MPLLSTKFYIPSVQPELALRPCLIERLKILKSGSANTAGEVEQTMYNVTTHGKAMVRLVEENTL